MNHVRQSSLFSDSSLLRTERPARRLEVEKAEDDSVPLQQKTNSSMLIPFNALFS